MLTIGDFNISLGIGDRGEILQELYNLFDIEITNAAGHTDDDDKSIFKISMAIYTASISHYTTRLHIS